MHNSMQDLLKCLNFGGECQKYIDALFVFSAIKNVKVTEKGYYDIQADKSQ